MNGEFIKQYKEQRERLRRHFEAERVGEQSSFIERSKLFKPLIETQKETSKAIQDKIVVSQETTNNALLPFVKELQKRNEQVEALQTLPFYAREIEAQSTPRKKDSVLLYDLDKILDESDIENLQDMSLELPSKVMEKENFEDVLRAIETLNRKYGQYMGKASTKDLKDQEIYKSRKQTLEKYKQTLLDQKPTLKYKVKKGEGLQRKLVKLKRSRGRPRMYPDVIVYNNPNDLVIKLNDYVTARAAGNTGVDNYINSILDELMNVKAIDKDGYDCCYKNIFTNI
jgi:hypothetical protein